MVTDGENDRVIAVSTKPRPPIPGGPYLVVGLARSGQAVARLLAARGERVAGSDSGTPEGAERLRRDGVEVELDGDGLWALEEVGCLVKSPGVPRQAPVVRAALEREIPVLGELELAWRLLPNRFVGVTGTNGKTTVSELLGHVWRRAGEPVAVAGNVGTPLATLVDAVEPWTTVICECSSFQLEDASAFAPECGVLLNVGRDHLDRHGTLDEYLQAKLRLFASQSEDDLCVYNGGDPLLRGTDLGGRGRRVAFCARREVGDACEALLAGGEILLRGEPLIRADDLSLPGPHNAENALAVAAAADAMGIDRKAIGPALQDFPGLPHRLECVGERAGVKFVNDSKATNAAAASAALGAFEPRTVRAILGGSPKGDGFTELAEPVAERCVACYLIGPAAEALERDLAPSWARGTERRRCGGLAEAVRAAVADAAPGEVILLVPACASFDAYRDYEQRGEHFREIVAGLLSR